MRFSKFLMGVAFAATMYGAVKADDCFVCDNVVEFDNLSARCFVADFEQHLSDIRASSTNWAEVDLSKCTGAVISGKRGLDSFPQFPGSDDPSRQVQPKPVRQIYILNEPGAICLKQKLGDLRTPIDPSIRYNLAKVCAE